MKQKCTKSSVYLMKSPHGLLLIAFVLWTAVSCSQEHSKLADKKRIPAKELVSHKVTEESYQATVDSSDTVAKYVFLFIGDGMGLNQAKLAQIYSQAISHGSSGEPLSFLSFPVQSLISTHSANSEITCSAASGTALSTGEKTNNGIISKNPTLSKNLPTVAEKAHQAGYKVGIVSSVSIDHATPAVFYAHQNSRSLYYEIAMDLGKSGFDYFAGGGFMHPTGRDRNQPDAYENASQNGYRIVKTANAFAQLSASSSKIFIIHPQLGDAADMPWVIDAPKDELTLKAFTAKGISSLSHSSKGFFMMVEGGKIDWACHKNDAATAILETLAFEKAVSEAVRFYNAHKSETLILVTADHETGGLSLGNNTTPMRMNVGLLKYQTASLGKLNDSINRMIAHNASFEKVLAFLGQQTGLDVQAGLALTPAEKVSLEMAYKTTLGSIATHGNRNYLAQEEDPSVAQIAIQLVNQKAGIGWGTLAHSGMQVPIYALGVGQAYFQRPLDNTEIPKIIEKMMRL